MYRLLIVDDEEIERNALKFVLNKSGYVFQEIREAANGQEAISQAALFEPEIIIMDIKMPGIDGIKASHAIKKILPQTKIIFLTAFNKFDYAKEAVKLGIEDYIIKPVSNDKLFEIIQKVSTDIEKEHEEAKFKQETEEKFNQITKYLESEFVTSIIQGNLEEKQAEEYLNFMNMTFEAGCGFAMKLKYQDKEMTSVLQQQMMKKRFLKIVEAFIQQRREPLYMSTYKEYVFILMMSHDYQLLKRQALHIYEYLQDISSEFMSQYNVAIGLGQGDVYSSMSNLWKSFLKGKNLCNKQYTDEPTSNESMLKDLVKELLCSNEEGHQVLIEKLVEKLILEADNMSSFKIKLYEWMIRINEKLKEINNTSIIEGIQLYHSVMEISSYHEGQLLLRNYIEENVAHIEKKKAKKNNMAMGSILEYIQRNYRENITLEQLADKFSLSTSYISRLFKKQFHTNYSDYLAKIRIDEAKKQLKSSNASVKEISYAIGYVDPNYFSRVFRKYEGVTPSEYRYQVSS